MKRFFKYFGITVLSLVGLVILLLMLLNLAIRPQNVQNLVERFSTEYINAEIKADTIEIHLLRNFPYASLSVSNCRIRSLAFEKLDSLDRMHVPEKADSLAKIGKLNIAVSLVDLLTNNLNVKRIELDSSEIYAYTSQFGINNWDILKPTADTTESGDSTSFEININKISIGDGAQVLYHSVPDSLDVQFSLNELLLKGQLSNDVDDNYLSQARLSGLLFSADYFNRANTIRFIVDSLDITKKHGSDKAKVDMRTRTNMKFQGTTLADNVPFNMEGEIEFDHSNEGKIGIDLDDFTLYAATIPLKMDGSLVVYDRGVDFYDLKGDVDNYSISKLIAYIPEKFFDRDAIKTNASISLHSHINGTYLFTNEELPVIDLSLSVPSTTLTVTNKKEGKSGTLDNIEASASLHFDQKMPKSNTLNISKLNVEGRGILLSTAGRISEYTLDPLLDIKVSSNFNLDTLVALIPIKTKITAHGKASADVSLQGRASALNLFSISQNDISAIINSDALKLKMPEYGIDFNCGKTSLSAGVLKNTNDTILSLDSKIFNVNLNMDTLYLNYKDSMLVSGSKLSMSASQEPPKVTKDKKRPPLKIDGKLTLGGMSFRNFDSTRVRLRKAESGFSITPWSDGKTPVLTFNTCFGGLGLTLSGSRIFARNSDLSVRIIAHAPKTKPAADTTVKREFDSKRFTRAVLRNWDVRGNVKAESGRLITPSLPLRTRFSNVNLAVSNDGLIFKDTKINLGNSSITLSGNLTGFAKAVTEHQTLSFAGSVFADSLDVYQLLQASANSKTVSMADNRSDDAIESAMQKAAETDTSEMKAPVLPGFLNSDINLDINNIKFKASTLKSIRGNLITRNGIFQLNKFRLTTKSGEVDLHAFYSAKKIDDISVGFDVKMNKFEVSDVIELIPDVDSLLPMLRSFSGKITCNLSAMSKIDSLFNLKMETLRGFGSIEGNEVVLMDGETFTEIAKMLKFKNRNKNLIDRISVQCVMADNKIEIFPFVLQMDRYKAAVSGTQNMDMSFKYHISVLKSPIPFRLGLNISGTVDDMKFSLGRCLYKSDKVPVYTSVLDSARVNLGRSIKDVFVNGVEKTLKSENSAKLAKIAEEEQQKTNGMTELSQKELKKLEDK